MRQKDIIDFKRANLEKQILGRPFEQVVGQIGRGRVLIDINGLGILLSESTVVCHLRTFLKFETRRKRNGTYLQLDLAGRTVLSL